MFISLQYVIKKGVQIFEVVWGTEHFKKSVQNGICCHATMCEQLSQVSRCYILNAIVCRV